MLSRPAKWIGGTLLVVVGLILIVLNLSNWNWLRGPLSRTVADKTGRELVIGGDLIVNLGWPTTHVRTSNLSFSNPAWAQQANMVAVRNIAFTLSMPPLFKRAVVLNEVALDAANIDLEKSSDGRKNWLLDKTQRDEKSRIQINSLTLREGKINFKDPAQKTDIQAELSTPLKPIDPASALELKAEGRFRGQALSAKGKGGSVLILRDKQTPYPLNITGSLGPSFVHAEGHITNLLQFSAIDLLIRLHGNSLAQLYPVLGIVLPDTPAYKTQGRLLREGKTWQYQNFFGQIGKSDIAGTFKVDTSKKPILLSGKLHSKKLNFADLGPLVGSKSTQSAAETRNTKRVLPDAPFRTERWDKMDADVTLKAESIIRDAALPINNLTTHLRLQNALLTLDPLNFGVAGGSLAGLVKLNGRARPIQATVDLKARKIRIAELFPTLSGAKTSIGLMNGDIDLKGQGDTVANMLGSADGRVALAMNQGEISKLMMEAVGLHLLEMLQLKLSGDKNIQIHCGVADFGVKKGVMRTNVFLLDTDITRLTVTGDINLREEALDLTLIQKSKKLSLIALRPPIHVRGNFVKPVVSLDKGKLAARGLGAVVLGIVNPVLALIPLVETGRDKDTDCGRLIKESKMPEKNFARPN